MGTAVRGMRQAGRLRRPRGTRAHRARYTRNAWYARAVYCPRADEGRRENRRGGTAVTWRDMSVIVLSTLVATAALLAIAHLRTNQVIAEATGRTVDTNVPAELRYEPENRIHVPAFDRD